MPIYDEAGLCRIGSADAAISNKPRESSPEAAAIYNEMPDCYIDYVNMLPDDCHAVCILSEIERLSDKEISKTLSLSLNTVKIRLRGAGTMLNDQLRKNCRRYHDENGDLMAEPKKKNRA